MEIMEGIKIITVTESELKAIINNALKCALSELNAHQKEEEPEIITRKDVCEMFNISNVCVHDWIKRGILKPYKIGNRTFFKRKEVMDYLYSEK
jgi:excisionase family DNA binding protein